MSYFKYKNNNNVFNKLFILVLKINFIKYYKNKNNLIKRVHTIKFFIFNFNPKLL